MAAGLDPDNLPPRGAIEIGKDIDIGARETRSEGWRDIWSAGHSTSSVTGILSIDDLVTQTRAQYRSAREGASSTGIVSISAMPR